MATEDELQTARRDHAVRQTELGFKAYPACWITDEELSSRRAFFRRVADADALANLPGEAEVGDADRVYTLVGRVVAKRGPFVVLRTPLGDAQALVRPEALSEAEAPLIKLIDLADHVRVVGPAMRTKTGAAACRARSLQPLGKALLPPPAKWHGLKDVEKRYRERYVDLFANPDVAKVFRARSAVVSTLRCVLSEREFLEVETPMLHPLRGGATARPFATHHNALDLPLYLRIAPELYLKRLLVGGLDRVFELGRSFRNEGISARHNPEFTMLELYQAYATVDSHLELTEALFKACDQAVAKCAVELRGQRTFALDAPWVRVSMRQSLCDRGARARAGALRATPWDAVLRPEVVFDRGQLGEACRRIAQQTEAESGAQAGAKVSEAQSADPAGAAAVQKRTYGGWVAWLFEQLVEEQLTELYRNADGDASLPVFVLEYPAEVSPLARRQDDDAEFVDRFELFIEGRELANAFTELNDPDDQAQRFTDQLAYRERGDEEAMDFDEDYIRALRHGLPPAAGLGIGVDRLVMALTGQASIRDVLLFPLLRPEGSPA